MCADSGKRLAISTEIKQSFPHSVEKVVEAVFMQVLKYDGVIYRHASSSTLKPLDSVCPLRFIISNAYGTHHCILFDRVRWSSLQERRDTQ